MFTVDAAIWILLHPYLLLAWNLLVIVRLPLEALKNWARALELHEFARLIELRTGTLDLGNDCCPDVT